jgi:hypothetical protein
MHTKSFVRDWGFAKNSACYKECCENTSTEPPPPPPSMSSPVPDLILLYSGGGGDKRVGCLLYDEWFSF